MTATVTGRPAQAGPRTARRRFAFTGLGAGVAVLAVIMAAGSAWGRSRRLAGYR